VKISVSLSAQEIEFLDSYAREQGFPSRSAALQHAIAVLRAGQLTGAYEDAWDSWTESGEAELWERVAADGLG
jgi:Arc/MetJ-type ribon-helix-helix transcriptional regulator